jgi:hypothetical protein
MWALFSPVAAVPGSAESVRRARPLAVAHRVSGVLVLLDEVKDDPY